MSAATTFLSLLILVQALAIIALLIVMDRVTSLLKAARTSRDAAQARLASIEMDTPVTLAPLDGEFVGWVGVDMGEDRPALIVRLRYADGQPCKHGHTFLQRLRLIVPMIKVVA